MVSAKHTQAEFLLFERKRPCRPLLRPKASKIRFIFVSTIMCHRLFDDLIVCAKQTKNRFCTREESQPRNHGNDRHQQAGNSKAGVSLFCFSFASGYPHHHRSADPAKNRQKNDDNNIADNIVNIENKKSEEQRKAAETKRQREIDLRKVKDREAAAKVDAAIAAIGTVAFTNDCQRKIAVARQLYDTLTYSQKAYVRNLLLLLDSESLYQRLEQEDNNERLEAERKRIEAAERAKQEDPEGNRLGIQETGRLIDAIGSVKFTNECLQRIGKARQAYNTLSESQKRSVHNYSLLEKAENDFNALREQSDTDTAAAQTVVDMINSLGDVSYTEEFRRKISSARMAYSNLSVPQRSLVSNYSKLTSADADYNNLRKASEKRDQSRKMIIRICIVAAAIVVCIGGFALFNSVFFTGNLSQPLSESFFTSAKQGDEFTLGKYEQDNNQNNGQEEIEWVVLENDNGKITAISKYCIEDMPFNDADIDTPTNWSDSTIREWLNTAFYESAFSDKEKSTIVLSHLTNPGNNTFGVDGGEDTEDYIFLIGKDMFESYYSDYNFGALEISWKDVEERMTVGVSEQTEYEPLKAQYTEYAKQKYIEAEPRVDYDDVEKEYGKNSCFWWTRVTGDSDYSMFLLFYSGSAVSAPAKANCGIRPVICVDMENWLVAYQGDANAQLIQGDKYHIGEGVEQNYREALKWFRLAANQGDATAQNCLGYMYNNGEGVEQNHEEALKWYRLAAEQGVASAQTNLGSMYAYGEGVGKDYEEALKWFRLAADQGYATAQNNLGYMYEYGEGVEKNYEEALKWYRLSADQVYATAQYNLGRMYGEGKGVGRDYEESLKWIKLSVDQGYGVAQYYLGYKYEHGEGVEQDYEEAIKWYRLSADQGYADAQTRLGYMYEHGVGVEKNYEESLKWYKLAADQGHAHAEAALKRIDELHSLSLSVRKGDSDEFTESVEASVGDVIEFEIEYRNHSGEQVDDVMIRDVLPTNLQYVNGTTKIYNLAYPEWGMINSEDICTSGINIGSYSAEGNAYIRFQALIVDKSLADGKTQLVNWASSTVTGLVNKDDASVLVLKSSS